MIGYSTYPNLLIWIWLPLRLLTQWAKSPKKQSLGVYFWQYGTVFWVPN